MKKKPVKLVLIICLLLGGIATAQVNNRFVGASIAPRIPVDNFSPSNTRTVDGNLIAVENFIPAERCASCHVDVHAAWSQSLHRNAAREPFYRESADILLRTRGIEFTRHCESCHTPVALLSGMLTTGKGSPTAPFTPFDKEGLTCVICHSIVDARPDGTGSYTIRRPALLVAEDGNPVFGDVSNEEIYARVDDHKRAMMRPLLRKPEFCATCHKVTAPPSLNGYKQIPGFSAYDEWQASGASLESLQSFYPRSERVDCRSCHMPKVPSTADAAAKDGVIALHRWPGANTAAPLFYGQTEQVDVIEKFLENKVLNIDIFALKSEASSALQVLTPQQENRLEFQPGEEITAEVVVANRNAAHSFPPEVRDLYEAWVEFEAIDAQGESLYHSGFIKPDGLLDQGAHVYKTIILDSQGKQITRHQIWLTTIKAYDNTIQAGRTDVVHYRFQLPKDMKPGPVTLKARVNYRRVNQEYNNYISLRQNRAISLPIVEMAETATSINTQTQRSHKSHNTTSLNKPEARRWNDYGIALLEQAQYGASAEAFRKAAEFDPTDSYLLVNIAIAEMRTEHFGPERVQLEKAAALLEKALQLDPGQPRARFNRALVWRGLFKYQEAADELTELSRLYPRDREVLRQLSQTLYTLGRLSEAQQAAEAILNIDPNDAGAYRLLAPIYSAIGRNDLAAKAEALYLQWREDPLAEGVAARFFIAHPEWQEERIGKHEHSSASASRPVLTGAAAAPVK